MSEAVSFLNGLEVTYNGVTVRDAGMQGMITLRGNLNSTKLKNVVKKLTGQSVPGVRKAHVEDGSGACWMSPDELLVLVPYADVGSTVTAIEKALNGTHFSAVNVSDARAYLTVSGASAREVIAKVAPVDLSVGSFASGDFRRTRLAQVAGAFWLDADGVFHTVCFRSVGHYVFGLMETGAKAGPVRALV